MVEAGSKVNWAFLDSGVADKIFFYYAPKILGGLESLPVAGGIGRRRRADAILMERVALHTISKEEFAVEAYVVKASETLRHVYRNCSGVGNMLTPSQRMQTGARLTVNCAAVLGGRPDWCQHRRQWRMPYCRRTHRLTAFPPTLRPKHCSAPIWATLRPGRSVNLERPLAANARLDGHFVLGHVDGTAELVSLDPAWQ